MMMAPPSSSVHQFDWHFRSNRNVKCSYVCCSVWLCCDEKRKKNKIKMNYFFLSFFSYTNISMRFIVFTSLTTLCCDVLAQFNDKQSSIVWSVSTLALHWNYPNRWNNVIRNFLDCCVISDVLPECCAMCMQVNLAMRCWPSLLYSSHRNRATSSIWKCRYWQEEN